ncbi:MAG: PKD domain-containing protein, partial [Gillisia sp.]|nr:PKD domain-containing protein [Gillisia sp.]
MKQFLKNAKAITILILMLSLTGCDNDDDNLPEVIAGFTHTINADTGTVTFINTSVNSKNYFWTFGDETSSTEINPVKTYPNGTYTIVLKASNVAGASNTFEDEITILIPEIATLPITFDGENTKYDAGVFGGASFEIVDNPDVSGTNDKASKVGAITNTGAEYEGINFDLGTQIDFTTNKTITMNFWADAEVDVLMKLEEGTGDDIEVTASHGGTGWEVISFDFNSSDKYSRLTLFVDGAGTTAGTFYIDDIMQIETPSAPCTPETAQSLAAADFNLTFETDPTASIIDDGAVMISVANPDPENDVNSSCQVGKVTRSPDFEYANNQIEFATKLDFNSNAGFKMKVWTPAVGTKVTVKLEGTGATEVLVTTTKANEWEELTFDFASSENGKYDKIVLFFNIETNTPGEFYIDDFMLYERAGGGTAPATAAPTPTQDAANVKSIFSDTYTDISGTNLDTNWQGDLVSETVTIEGNEAVKYSNVKFIGMELAADTDFSDMEFLHIDVWTPDATVLEITPISPPNENLVGLSGLSQGEWKSFDIPISDFTGVDFSKILQFKIDAQKGVIPAIVYMDNLYFYKTGGGTACTDTTLVLPIDFDCEGIDYASKILGNVSFSVIDNPELSGINNVASKVGSIVNVGANWENAFFNLDTPIDFSANNTIKFKFYSTVSVDLKLKMEDGTAVPVEVDVNHGGTGWEELSFTFTNTDS